MHAVFFIFTWFFIKNKTFQAHLCRKQAFLFCYSACKKHAFFLYSLLMQRKLEEEEFWLLKFSNKSPADAFGPGPRRP